PVHPNDDSLPDLPNSNLQNQNSTYWRPLPSLQTLYDKFQNNILAKWPQIACIYWGKLLYPEKASWIFYNLSTIYPLQTNIPDIFLSFNSNVDCIPKLRVFTCISFLDAFLGTNNNNTNNSVNDPIYNNETLHHAANWLAQNNPYLHLLANNLSSNKIKFLNTEPPLTRTHAVLPIFIIEEDDENLYYDDTIMKYMFRPYDPDFENLTYFQYFEKYLVTPFPPAPTQYRELYFYQQLLLKVLARNESDYKITSN
ncbi:20441_t:CDS:2, partial [Gigaspora margarita]